MNDELDKQVFQDSELFQNRASERLRYYKLSRPLQAISAAIYVVVRAHFRSTRTASKAKTISTATSSHRLHREYVWLRVETANRDGHQDTILVFTAKIIHFVYSARCAMMRYFRKSDERRQQRLGNTNTNIFQIYCFIIVRYCCWRCWRWRCCTRSAHNMYISWCVWMSYINWWSVQRLTIYYDIRLKY